MNWWNEWWSRFDNRPENLGALVARVDDAVRTAGRDPADVTKSVAVLVSLGDSPGRLMGAEQPSQPVTGSSEEIADRLLAFSDLVDHVQLVVDPITTQSIEALEVVVDKIHSA